MPTAKIAKNAKTIRGFQLVIEALKVAFNPDAPPMETWSAKLKAAERKDYAQALLYLNQQISLAEKKAAKRAHDKVVRENVEAAERANPAADLAGMAKTILTAGSSTADESSVVAESPTDAEMLAAGFKETHGIALWTKKGVPELVDCNAEAVSVFASPRAADDGADFYPNGETNAFLAKHGIPVRAVKF
jgi:hypothetical protein